MNTASPAIFFDFDMTVTMHEGLEDMIVESLSARKDGEKLMDEVRHITTLGMEGKICFKDSVKRRLGLAPITHDQFDAMGQTCMENITPGMERVFEWLREKNCNIYIVSGGFEEFIFPAAERLGVPRENCLANGCNYSDAGVCVSPDESKPAWNGDGKHHVVQYVAKRDSLSGKKIMVGDSIGDLAAYTNGVADDFVAFTANIRRPVLVERSVYVADTSEELQAILEGLLTD